MEVSVGKYIIKSDSQSMWIEEKYKGKSRDGREIDQTRRVSGYVRTFTELLASFAERKVRESTATEIKEMLQTFAECERDIKTLIDGWKNG